MEEVETDMLPRILCDAQVRLVGYEETLCMRRKDWRWSSPKIAGTFGWQAWVQQGAASLGAGQEAHVDGARNQLTASKWTVELSEE